ncbi:hypothetical protein Tco_0786023 [Tanacetum coccineum]
MKIHHGGRFTNLPRRKYVDGEVAFVDLIDINQCKIDILDTVMYQSLDYEEKMFYHYKILLKGLDIGLRLLASDTDIDKILKYVHKHKIIYVYVEHDKSVVDHALNVDEVGPSKILRRQNSDGEDEAGGEVDEEHIVDEVEVKMNGFKFEVESEYVKPMQPKLNMTEIDLEVLDFDSFESDVDDAKESARRKGLRKLRKEEGNSTLKTSSFVRKEFTNRDLAKEMIGKRKLLDARDSPIISCLEYVREYLIKRIVIVQKGIKKSGVPLTPVVTSIYRAIKEKYVEWYVVVGNGKFLVFLSSMFWGCIHDTTDNGMDVGLPEDWVHQSYTLQTWRDVYSFKVNPVNGRPKKRKKSVTIEELVQVMQEIKEKQVKHVVTKGQEQINNLVEMVEVKVHVKKSQEHIMCNKNSSRGTKCATPSASQAGGNVVGSQAAATVSPMRRTKKNALRLTLTK